MPAEMKVEEFQQRVIKEKVELDSKIQRLVAFTTTRIFMALDDAEKGRLQYQCDAMYLYSRILGDRIAAFHG